MKKKMVARVVSMIMAGILAVGMLAGCGSGTSENNDSGRGHSRQETAVQGAGGDVDVADGGASDPVMWETEATADVAYDSMNGFAMEAPMAAAEACYDYGYEEIPYNTEEYSTIEENPYMSVALSPLSTFSADVDTASYANLRRMITNGYTAADIPSGAVRTEEMLNYFTYDYNGPKKGEPFGVTATISQCPWNENAELLVLGLQTEAIDFSDAPDSNLVFLIDVSGSMYDENKLPLLKQAFGMLVDNLGEKDRVSIVTYASYNEVVLEGVPGSEKDMILEALNRLEAGGSTNGGEGIMTAYDLAEKYFIKGGNNRIILATDGDLNVGITSESALHDLVEEKRESGVFLSVLGFGMGNYSDTRMETLADYGNGNYAYIDSLSEARKVLVEEMGATLVTVAKDVKLQIEFNPAVVAEYRLIGYENRTMAAEDFDNDEKDAGEIGAGHSVTVVYEIITCDNAESSGNELRYQNTQLSELALNSDEWMTLSIRYKEPDGDVSKLLEYPIGADDYTQKPSDDFIFAAAVAEFSMVLRDSEYLGDESYEDILDMLDDIDLDDEYKEEFYNLVDLVRVRENF